jgi:hypothetical protein
MSLQERKEALYEFARRWDQSCNSIWLIYHFTYILHSVIVVHLSTLLVVSTLLSLDATSKSMSWSRTKPLNKIWLLGNVLGMTVVKIQKIVQTISVLECMQSRVEFLLTHTYRKKTWRFQWIYLYFFIIFCMAIMHVFLIVCPGKNIILITISIKTQWRETSHYFYNGRGGGKNEIFLALLSENTPQVLGSLWFVSTCFCSIHF